MASEYPRRSIKEPIAAIFEAWELLSSAADAHLEGNLVTAEALFRKANLAEVWHWTNPAWGPSPSHLRLNVRVWKPEGDTKPIAKAERDPRRDPSPQTKAAVLARDGYRCRYCGIPVVDASIRKVARTLYPDAVSWSDSDVHQQHAAFQCFWLQYDHVVPHSHGGSSSESNVVVTCALCNYGKDQYTLRQLGIADPRQRAPAPVPWDGLERLRDHGRLHSARVRSSSNKGDRLAKKVSPDRTRFSGVSFRAFFLPGAWISAGYVFTPPIGGKERWFKLGRDLVAEATTREGARGCRVLCDPQQFTRRGLAPDDFAD